MFVHIMCGGPEPEIFNPDSAGAVHDRLGVEVQEFA